MLGARAFRETGALDVAIVKGPDVLRLRNDKNLTSKLAKPFTVDPMQMNELPDRVTADIAVREALMTAVDPKAWNQAMNNGEGVLSSSFITSNTECFEPATAALMPTPSLDKAKQILTAAGWTAGADGKFAKGGKPLAIKVLGNTTQNAAPEYLVDQFTKLGATVTLERPDFATFAGKWRNGEFDVSVSNVSLASPTPASAVQYLAGTYIPGQAINPARVNDPELDRAVTAAKESAGAERCRNWSIVQKRFLEQKHILPMAGQVTSVFARAGFDFFQIGRAHV